MMIWLGIVALLIVAWLFEHYRPGVARHQSRLGRLEAEDAEASAIRNMVARYGVAMDPAQPPQRSSETMASIRALEQRVGHLELELESMRERMAERDGEVTIIPFREIA